MATETTKCARPGCSNDGFLQFTGRPEFKYCQACYECLAKKISLWNREMRAIRRVRRLSTFEENQLNEQQDHQPARIGPEQ